jgi:hypothetical protein
MNPNTAILEFRAGPGGEEAKIWADDLMRMYTRYANIMGWKVSEISETAIKIKGDGVFDKLQYEAGTQRVQRVPSTERQGRIHTSTATVAVLPEVPEADLSFRNEDLEWDFHRAGGHDGLNFNVTCSSDMQVPASLSLRMRTDRSLTRVTSPMIVPPQKWRYTNIVGLSCVLQRHCLTVMLRPSYHRTQQIAQSSERKCCATVPSCQPAALPRWPTDSCSNAILTVIQWIPRPS